jgi:tRNA A37 threonylcarbamoyladenosine biosynthesis protein TsaE
LVEWPEKIEPLIPDDAMVVRITAGDGEERIFEIE